MGFKLVADNTVCEFLESENCCDPTPIGMVNELAPAGALKTWLLLPEVTCTVPADLSNETIKTLSVTVCQPLGRPM